MIAIEVTPEAYAAIAASLPEGASLRDPQKGPKGGFLLWLARSERMRLEALRRPSEGYSEAILRLSRLEAER